MVLKQLLASVFVHNTNCAISSLIFVDESKVLLDEVSLVFLLTRLYN